MSDTWGQESLGLAWPDYISGVGVGGGQEKERTLGQICHSFPLAASSPTQPLSLWHRGL